MTEQPKKSIKDNVLKAIETGRVTMRPKWQFVLRTVLFVLGIVLVSLFVLYLASFIVYMLRVSGVWFAPGFGFAGIGIFLRSLPWLLVLIALIFIVLLEILIKKYSFSYGKPFLYSAFGLIGLVVLGGVGIGFSSFHESFRAGARANHVPVEPFYKRFETPPQNVTLGTILEIVEDDYTIETPRDEMFTVLVDSTTQFPSGLGFQIDDEIIVFGPRHTDGTIDAVAIQKPGLFPPPHRKRY